MAILTPDQVRLFIRDQIEYNRLIDELEFTDERIQFAMDLTLDMFNVMTPVTTYLMVEFPNRYLLLMGTLGNLFRGEAAMAARNQMSYSDGGLTIPIEERFEYYTNLADRYSTQFSQMAQQLKIYNNIADGWGDVDSDYTRFPSF